uniref:Uncharacterized protein n=1 Tax=Parascaris univalens TaxID=6257 RepID=A0A915AAI6_PARUN
MEETQPQSQLSPADAQSAVSERAQLDQIVAEGRKHDDRKGNPDNDSSLELYRQMFAGDGSTKEFFFTQKCIPCHRCSGNMRLCMRKVRYRSIIKNYPTYRCTRKNCQTFCSPRTLTRRLRNVAYDKLRNREVLSEISPQAKRQLLAAFGTCLAASADGSPTSYSTERAKFARDKLAVRAVSEATVLLRAMLADDSCSISLALKTAIRDLSSVLSCFSNIPISGSESQKLKLKKESFNVPGKSSTISIKSNKRMNDNRESPDGGSSSAMSDELSATVESDLEESASRRWSEQRVDRSSSVSPISDADMASVVGYHKSFIPRVSTRPWVKVSKFSSSFTVTIVHYAGWETVETMEGDRDVGDNQIMCLTSAFNEVGFSVFIHL